MKLVLLALAVLFPVFATAEQVEFRDDGMVVIYNGNVVHSHYNDKVWGRSQIESSVQRFITAKLPDAERERILRQGGVEKAEMDVYFDELVASIRGLLLSEAEKHRTALSYERAQSKLPRLSVLLNGIPEEVEDTYIDDNGDEQTRMVPNPLREGFPEGHVMLTGLPEQIEVDVVNESGGVIGTERADNPERQAVQTEYDMLSAAVEKITLDADVMAIVQKRRDR